TLFRWRGIDRRAGLDPFLGIRAVRARLETCAQVYLKFAGRAEPCPVRAILRPVLSVANFFQALVCPIAMPAEPVLLTFAAVVLVGEHPAILVRRGVCAAFSRPPSNIVARLLHPLADGGDLADRQGQVRLRDLRHLLASEPTRIAIDRGPQIF